jgi:hypothetical protein
MIAPAVIPVAFRTAIFALIFPAVFGAVLHAELFAARWVLADQRFVIRALAATETMAISESARPCLKLFAAPCVDALNFDTFTAGNPTTRF